MYEKEELLADVGCGSLKSVELVVAAADKLLFFLVSDNLKESLGAFWYNEETNQLLHCAGADRKCRVFRCVDDALNNSFNLMSVRVGQLSGVLQRYGDKVSPRKTKPFPFARLCPT